MVTLSDVTRTGARAAFEESGHLGREAFLKSTGFGPARAYFLQHDGASQGQSQGALTPGSGAARGAALIKYG